ncbi:MAG: AAA family ATPase, partial [Acidimicrobiia bacterium]
MSGTDERAARLAAALTAELTAELTADQPPRESVLLQALMARLGDHVDDTELRIQLARLDEFVTQDRLRRIARRVVDAEEVTSDDADRLRRWTPKELVDALQPYRWVVRGVLVDPTYGMAAGERKTLKTYVASALVVATTSKTKLFGHFDVPEQRPALVFVGEGGRDPYTRRMRRIAASMGVHFEDLPIITITETADAGRSRFRHTLETELAETAPGLVLLDPWYAYHGVDTQASSLFEEGALLTALSGTCIDAGASLLVNNHFNKTGRGNGLGRITQSGAAEWSDSWLLLSHREEPDVEAGRFRLLLEVGSRQWGGSTWDLDVDLGRFDQDLGEYDGDITWAIRPHAAANGCASGEGVAAAIIDVLADQPWAFTKSDVKRLVGGKRALFDEAWEELRAEDSIVSERLPH